MATVPYRPSNGTEGEGFIRALCERCERDPFSRDEDAKTSCRILARTMAYDVGDPEYPKQWISEEDGSDPRCTAFRPLGERSHARRRPPESQLGFDWGAP